MELEHCKLLREGGRRSIETKPLKNDTRTSEKKFIGWFCSARYSTKGSFIIIDTYGLKEFVKANILNFADRERARVVTSELYSTGRLPAELCEKVLSYVTPDIPNIFIG